MIFHAFDIRGNSYFAFLFLHLHFHERDNFSYLLLIVFRRNSFINVLLCSMFLGFLGVDRFLLGHIGAAIVKLLTLGGVGVWWMMDIILLVSGVLRPDGLWEPLY